ncbi:MAG: type II toxin-antitoxin system prevent-host-death family antitoxin [Spirochaetales bacterium]|nr:type II toxin-antitoxin system prevent-host-death family antitoxin [Spirochaetales bacterium]
MIIQENIHMAKTHFSKLLEKALLGDEVIIARAGKPIAKIVPIKDRSKTRKPGLGKGKIIEHENILTPMSDDFMEFFT